MLMAQTGIPIRSLQRMLRVISGYDASVLPVVPDGIYGRDTMASVTSFQQNYRLPVTGVADLTTWQTVVDVFRRATLAIGPAAPVQIVWQPGQTIVPGEANENLYLAQSMFLAIRRHFPAVPAVMVTGVFDEPTTQAVLWLQTCCALPPTATLDRPTWLHLTRMYRAVIGDGTRK